jgi:hypothetical protein
MCFLPTAMVSDSPMPSLLSLENGHLGMVIDPQQAGRVLALTFRGKNLLCGPEVNPTNFGATYWTSPQADWGWPPLAEVDHLPFEADGGDQRVKLVGPIAQLGERKFRIIKCFSQGVRPGLIETEYSIENCGDTPFSMANWEISRVPPGGLTFYPTGERELTPIEPHGALATEKVAGATFYDHSRFVVGRSLKLHADGRGGYLAHLAGSTLLLKTFVDTVPEQQAPKEGECEIFANEDGRYVEIEVQGAFEEIRPGRALTTWIGTYATDLPPSLDPSDRIALKAFVDDLAVELSE